MRSINLAGLGGIGLPELIILLPVTLGLIFSIKALVKYLRARRETGGASGDKF